MTYQKGVGRELRYTNQCAGLRAYHGSPSAVKKIDLRKCKAAGDFGKAFYLTTSKEQAESWARTKRRRRNSIDAVVNVYEISGFESLSVKVFKKANDEWLDFIVANRTRLSHAHTYDVVIGPVADDKTQEVIINYIGGAYRHFGISEKEKVLEFLEPLKLKNQIALCSQCAIDRVKYISHIVL